MGGSAIVHLPFPEEVSQAVDVGDGKAVEYHTEEVGGGLVDAGADLVAAAPALAALHHVMNGRRRDVGRGLEPHGAGATESSPFLNKTHSPLGLLRAEEIQRTQLVIFAPASPVGQGVEVP